MYLNEKRNQNEGSSLKERKNRREEKIARLPNSVYNGICAFLIALIIIFMGTGEYVYHSFKYAGYTRNEISGTIEQVGEGKFDVKVKFKQFSINKPYFCIDGEWVRTSFLNYDKYKVGDSFSYYKYTRGDNVYRSLEWLSIIKALIFILIQIIIYMTIYLFFDTNTAKTSNKKLICPQGKKIRDYSNKELYELCNEYGVVIPVSKKKNRKYLENLVRHIQLDEKIRKEMQEESDSF